MPRSSTAKRTCRDWWCVKGAKKTLLHSFRRVVWKVLFMPWLQWLFAAWIALENSSNSCSTIACRCPFESGSMLLRHRIPHPHGRPLATASVISLLQLVSIRIFWIAASFWRGHLRELSLEGQQLCAQAGVISPLCRCGLAVGRLLAADQRTGADENMISTGACKDPASDVEHSAADRHRTRPQLVPRAIAVAASAANLARKPGS